MKLIIKLLMNSLPYFCAQEIVQMAMMFFRFYTNQILNKLFKKKILFIRQGERESTSSRGGKVRKKHTPC